MRIALLVPAFVTACGPSLGDSDATAPSPVDVPAQYLQRTGFVSGELDGSIETWSTIADPAAGLVEVWDVGLHVLLRGETEGVVMTGLSFWFLDMGALEPGDVLVLDRSLVDEEFEYAPGNSGVSSFSCGGPSDDDFRDESSHDYTEIEVLEVAGEVLTLRYYAEFEGPSSGSGLVGTSEGTVTVDLGEAR